MKKRFRAPQEKHSIINAGLEEAQAGIKIARRNINHLRYADYTTLMADSEEKLKCLLMKVKMKYLSLTQCLTSKFLYLVSGKRFPSPIQRFGG